MTLDPDSGTPDLVPRPGVEPVYPTGPALHVPREAVQLTFLDMESFRASALESADGAQVHPGLELRTPLGIRLPAFEGPLDLLLYLIRRDELDIYDIPIAHMTEQYLAMLGVLTVLDLEVAGDFLVMAATLMRIKARLLLPTWPEAEEEEDDPRAELVRQLLEYRQFKEAAHRLRDREEIRRQWYGRGYLPEAGEDVAVPLEPVSHFVLIELMRDVLARLGEKFFYEVELEDVTLEEKIDLVLGELAARGRVLFAELMTRFPRRIHVVVTFMAVLELAKLGKVAVAQEAAFGQIWVYPVEGGRVVTSAPVPDPTEN